MSGPCGPRSLVGANTQKTAALQAALAENFGWALPAAVRSVYEQADQAGQPLAVELRETAEAHFEELKSDAVARGHELSGAHLRGLKRLALVSAVGAAVAEVVPFSEEQVVRAVDAAAEAWLGDVEFASAEDAVLKSLREYVTSNLHRAHVEQRRAYPPEGGWPYFYFEQQQVIVFKKEQLQRACEGKSLRVITDSLRRHNLLKGEEAGHKDAKIAAFMFGVVAPGTPAEQARHVRAYHLHVAGLLPDAAAAADRAAVPPDAETSPVVGHAALHGGDGLDGEAGGGFWPLHQDETFDEGHPDDQGEPPRDLTTAVMPTRKAKTSPAAEHHGPESVPPTAVAGAEPASEADENG